MKLDITNFHFEELIKKGYSVDMIVMLDWINRDLDVEHMVAGSVRIKSIYDTMKRKFLITDEGRIAERGLELLSFVSKKTNKKLEKRKNYESEFDQWWDVFPRNDIFELKGKKFQGTRSLRTSKEACRLLFNKYIADKVYTAKQIIEATNYDVNLRKNNSFRSGKNHLTFLQNSATYLRQASFDGFIGMNIKEQKKPSVSRGSIDI